MAASSNMLVSRPIGRGVVGAATLGLLLLTGCGGDGRFPVSGTVTYNGATVSNLFVMFEPEKDGTPAWGGTDRNGRVVLQGAGAARGILPGRYRVWVDYRASGPEPGTPMPADGFGPPPKLRAVLARYTRETSRLTVEVIGPRDDLKIEL